MKVLFARALEDGSLIEKWMSGMSCEKRSRVGRMRRREDVLTAVTAYRLLCFSLKSAYGIEPSPDDWLVGEYGKPCLKSAKGIHFNISHSGNMAMCALGGRQVGADIEMVRPYRQGLEKRIMSESERRVFLRSDDKLKLFYQIWTLKESYLKYTGRGLGALGEITVLPGETVKSNVPGCRFQLIDCIPGYQSAVCTETARLSSGPEENEGLIWGSGARLIGSGELNNF